METFLGDINLYIYTGLDHGEKTYNVRSTASGCTHNQDRPAGKLLIVVHNHKCRHEIQKQIRIQAHRSSSSTGIPPTPLFLFNNPNKLSNQFIPLFIIPIPIQTLEKGGHLLRPPSRSSKKEVGESNSRL